MTIYERKYTVFIYSIVFICQYYVGYGRTKADSIRYGRKGNATVIQGVLLGDIATIRKGLHEGGHYDTLLTVDMRETIRYLGKENERFPICPAIHLAFYLGNKPQLDVVMLLTRLGADMNDYRIPTVWTSNHEWKQHDCCVVNNESYDEKEVIQGYPPAILYSLGLGRQTLNSDAAFLLRISESLPDVINMSTINKWISLTGNPPLLQIAILANFFDGVYVLVENLGVNVNEVDIYHYNCTALHIAAYIGDSFTIKYLINRGANPLIKDIYGRTPLFYAGMRGYSKSIAALFSWFQHVPSEEVSNVANLLINTVDSFNMSVVDIAEVNHVTVTWLQTWFNDHNITIKYSSSHKWRKGMENTNFTIDFNGDEKTVDNNDNNDNSENKHQIKYSHINNRLIDHIDASNIDLSSFRKEYYICQRPVQITNNLFHDQPIWAYVYEKEFVRHYQGLISYIYSGEKIFSDKDAWNIPNPINITLEDWINNYIPIDNVDNNVWPWVGYSNPIQAEYLNHDIITPNIFRLCHKSKTNQSTLNTNTNNNRNGNVDQSCHNDQIFEPFFYFTIGGRRSGSPMQHKNASWNLLLVGQVRWFLLPPGYNYASRGRLKEIGDFSVDTMEIWIDKVLPDLINEGILFETIQYPGDVIFIPHDWSFAIYNDENSIMISQDICPVVNTDMRYQPITMAIYGERDEFLTLGSWKQYSYTHKMKNNK